MPAPSPKPRSLQQIKNALLRPALTSHYETYFNLPPDVKKFLDQKIKAGIAAKGYDAERNLLLCCEASLPGSSLATIEANNDYTGVTERHAYRRLYDDRADFTFYVDHDYSVISLFEIWMQYIADEQISRSESPGLNSPNYFYRFNYPDGTGEIPANGGKPGYRTEVYINKFEKDYEGRALTYKFLQAYPVSINSMPISYEGSQLLKCTVSFTYTRYVIETFQITKDAQPATSQSTQNTDPRSPANPGSRYSPEELEAFSKQQSDASIRQGRLNRSRSNTIVVDPRLRQ